MPAHLLVVSRHWAITWLLEPDLDLAASAFGAFHPRWQIGQRIVVAKNTGKLRRHATHAMAAATARDPQQQSVANRIAKDGLTAAEFSLGTHKNKQ